MKKILKCIFLSFLILLTGCTSETNDEKQNLADNQYYLMATDGTQILVSLPDDYTSTTDEKEQSALKSYYCSNQTEPLTLHYFKETEEYSVDDIRTEMSDFESQYQTLVDSNHGTIDSSTGLSELTVGEQSGQYIALTYTLDNHTSYCMEFYLKKGQYILHGTQRLNEPPKDDVTTFLQNILTQ